MTNVRYQRSPRAVWRATSSFLVAAVPPHPPSRVVGSASMVWSLLSVPRSEQELAELLAATVALPVQQVRADVSALIAQLLPLGLVEVVA